MDGPQMIVWTESARQCVVWAVDHRSELRIFDGPALIHAEPLVPTAGWSQARRLRRVYGAETAGDRKAGLLAE